MTKLMNKYKKQLDGVRMGKSSYLQFIFGKFIYSFLIISYQPAFQHGAVFAIRKSIATVRREYLSIDINFLQIVRTPTSLNGKLIAI